jgi:hypothetical protein
LPVAAPRRRLPSVGRPRTNTIGELDWALENALLATAVAHATITPDTAEHIQCYIDNFQINSENSHRCHDQLVTHLAAIPRA